MSKTTVAIESEMSGVFEIRTPAVLHGGGWIHMVCGSTAHIEASGWYSPSDPEIKDASEWLWAREGTAEIRFDRGGKSYRQTRKGGKWKEVR